MRHCQLATRRRSARSRRGLSYAEVMMAAIIVGVMLSGAMNLLGSVIRGRTATGQTARAHHYAQQLMTEILSTAYVDGSSPVFGPETGETGGTRAPFDDVDDFHNWSESPLVTRSGGAVANSTGWTRTVSVALVNATAPATTVAADSGVKRITVTVSRSGTALATLVALRSNAAP
jgi:Tfp pilus assembly protein PilV